MTGFPAQYTSQLPEDPLKVTQAQWAQFLIISKEIQDAWDVMVSGGSPATKATTQNVLIPLLEQLPELNTFKCPCPEALRLYGEPLGAAMYYTEYAICPSQWMNPTQLATVIMHLNDAHTWTREAIADWLDTLDVDLTFKLGEGNGSND